MPDILRRATRALNPTERERLVAGWDDAADYVEDLRGGRDVGLETLDSLMADFDRRKASGGWSADRAVSDRWLAPRLHWALRLFRSEAADREMWLWLGLRYSDYVRWRWSGKGDKEIPEDRWCGPIHKQALSRLWWGGELFRDGSDYRPVSRAFVRQDLPNSYLHRPIVRCRSVALAILGVANGPKVAEVTLALNWLKQNAAELRNQRLAPLAERARHIWATLRQESNVGLGAIRLEGEATRRHVQLDADIDGVRAGAFGVMSQGELHALALALFLPRATAPESPFRFVVLDDPIQAMDPSKVEGFVTVMQELAQDRQVIVLSHDDRLPAAIRRTAMKAQIFEITRGSGSVLTLTDATFPSMRYLDDAYAFSMDAEVPSDAKNRVVPGLCRLALETAAYEVFSARAYSAGVDRIGIEVQWAGAPKLKQRLALALHLDREAPITAWLQGSSRRSDAMRICNQGVHTGVNGNPVDDVRAVRTAVKDLRAAT